MAQKATNQSQALNINNLSKAQLAEMLAGYMAQEKGHKTVKFTPAGAYKGNPMIEVQRFNGKATASRPWKFGQGKAQLLVDYADEHGAEGLVQVLRDFTASK
jgi:hypothetical protein